MKTNLFLLFFAGAAAGFALALTLAPLVCS